MRILSENDFRPRFLDAEEELEPRRVIHDLFELKPLPYLREGLWEFFKTMVIGNYSHGLDRHERQQLVVCYEHLQKLIEAIHLIYRSEMYEPKKFDPNEIFKEVFESMNLDTGKLEENSGENIELPT